MSGSVFRWATRDRKDTNLFDRYTVNSHRPAHRQASVAGFGFFGLRANDANNNFNAASIVSATPPFDGWDAGPDELHVVPQGSPTPSIGGRWSRSRSRQWRARCAAAAPASMCGTNMTASASTTPFETASNYSRPEIPSRMRGGWEWRAIASARTGLP